MDKKAYISLAILVLLFFSMEYLYLPVEDNATPIKIYFSDFSVRLDSYIYFASIKVEQFIFVGCLHIILPMKKYTKWVMLAFFAAIIEYPLTYNEPVYKIDLPLGYIPVSVASLKFISVANFMVGCARRYFGDEGKEENIGRKG